MAGLLAATAGDTSVRAQDAGPAATLPVNLIADRVSLDQKREVLTAEGHVEVLYEGRILRATRITYDRRADRIEAEGPLTIIDPDGSILLADAATLDPELRDGLVEGARVLIDNQLQVAATEVRRSGRFTTLHRTVASSCTICPENPVPTWAIRAARVTEDAEAQRIYFENATFEVVGIPVFYLPRMSVPDPRAGRASGLLIPRALQSDIYGFGAKLPYYIALGPTSDATLTPFVTTGGTMILEGEYRRRFTTGGFDASGAFALDDGLGGGAGRGFITTQGAFALGRGFVTDFDVNLASDRRFLQQFDYTDADRLTSTVGIHRTRGKDNLHLGMIAFQSLRESEDTGTVPFVLPTLSYRRILQDPLAGGRLAYDIDVLGLLRRDGRDMLRGGGGLDWRRGWQSPQGVLAETTASAAFDIYQVWDDPEAPDRTFARILPEVTAELRWPWMRQSGGASDVVQPIVQLIWSEIVGNNDTVPNEDSQLPEFDETNLFSANRFPGRDRYETGLRANLGITYDRIAPGGWEFGMTLGRVLQTNPNPDMPEGTGLAGRWSDYVGAASIGYGPATFAGRALFDSEMTFRRNDIGLGLHTEMADVNTTWVYLAADDSNPILGPQPETSELRIDARYRVRPNVELRGLYRYDLAANDPLRAGVSVTYGNECTELDLSISRRYTSSDNLPPATSVGFSVQLAGLGDPQRARWPDRVCRGGAG